MPIYELVNKRPSLPADGSSWIAPSAEIIGDAQLGSEVNIWFGAVVRADNTAIIIGDRTNVQEGAMLHSDPGSPLTIGTDCTIGHHAVLHGCTLGDNVLVGMGATIMNGATIGDNCLISAGALVTEGKTLPSGSLIMGVPARAVRSLDESSILSIKNSATSYVEKSRLFAKELRRIDYP